MRVYLRMIISSGMQRDRIKIPQKEEFAVRLLLAQSSGFYALGEK